jgi:hypothetical protein
MRPRYLVLLRAITNVGMQPFRQAIEELGFTPSGAEVVQGAPR